MTISEIPKLRLSSQFMSATMLKDPQSALAMLGAVQAQDYAGSKWSLGMRLVNATEDLIEEAFSQGKILRTHMLRPTWHYVTPVDIRWLLTLTAPRVQAINATYCKKVELDTDSLNRSNSAIEGALRGGTQLTRDELREVVSRAGVSTTDDLRMSCIMMNAELEGIVCSGARRGKQFTYALLDERAPHYKKYDRETALAELAYKYFTTRGPATVHDFAKWSGLTVSDARQGIYSIKSPFQCETLGGNEYWYLKSLKETANESPTAYLLSIYDEYISSYKDRTAIISDEHSEILKNISNALSYIIVIDGKIVGNCKRTLNKNSVTIKTNYFYRLTKIKEQAVEKVLQKYGDYLGVPVEHEF